MFYSGTAAKDSWDLYEVVQKAIISKFYPVTEARDRAIRLDLLNLHYPQSGHSALVGTICGNGVT